MKKILFYSNGKAVLPEIKAYQRYFTEYVCVDSRDVVQIDFNEYDLIWQFMGTGFKRIDRPTIHEFASASIGSLPKVKNFIKSKFSARPDLRIFLNHLVKKQFCFNDRIPYVYRDMGVDEIFFAGKSVKEYDFLYIGDIVRERNTHVLLNKFATEFKKYNILLIGKCDGELYKRYKNFNNMIFTGRIKQEEIPQLATKCVYAINYIPNIYPFNIQTSTKLLEYAAMDLKIITTDYWWVRNFELENNMKFYKIDEDFSNFHYAELTNYKFKNNDMNKYLWKNVLDTSRIKDHIQKLI